jgi:ABC-2 type transport system permease protein
MALVGNIIHYQVGAIIASAAFYWEEAYSLLMVKNMIVGILSGEVIPLYLFPAGLSWIWKATPFYLYVFGPVQILMGEWDAFEITKNFGIAVLWMIGLGLLTQLAWRRGIYKYQSLGG